MKSKGNVKYSSEYDNILLNFHNDVFSQYSDTTILLAGPNEKSNKELAPMIVRALKSKEDGGEPLQMNTEGKVLLEGFGYIYLLSLFSIPAFHLRICFYSSISCS